jgi:hypothetical protein
MSLIQVYIFESTLNSASFDTHDHDLEMHDLSYKGQLTQTDFLAIFLTFVRYTTHIRVTFVQNVKK